MGAIEDLNNAIKGGKGASPVSRTFAPKTPGVSIIDQIFADSPSPTPSQPAPSGSKVDAIFQDVTDPNAPKLIGEYASDPTRGVSATYKDEAGILAPAIKYMTPGVGSQLLVNDILGLKKDPVEEASKRLVDNRISAVGFGLFWANRGYSGVMSMADAATSGKPILSEGLSGLTGQRNASMINLMENFGADKHKWYNQLVAAGLDVFPGMFVDPLSYVGVGVLPKLKNVATAVKLMGNVDDVTRAAMVASKVQKGEWSARFASKLAGLEELPGRAELAKRGLWGLNVKIPYMPVVTPLVEKVAGSGVLPITREGITVTPRFINEMAAKGIDKLSGSPWLNSAHDGIRQIVGGQRYMFYKAGLGPLYDASAILKARANEEAIIGQTNLRKMSESIPVELRRELEAKGIDLNEQMFHALENPAELDAQGPVKAARPLTPQEIAARDAEKMKLLQATAEAVEEFNRSTKAEITGIRTAMQDWTESRRRLRVIDSSDLEAYSHNVNAGDYVTGTFLEQFVQDLNQVPQRAESLITGYLRDRHGYPIDGPDVTFKAIVGQSQYYALEGHMVPSRPRAPLSDPKAAGKWKLDRMAELRAQTPNADLADLEKQVKFEFEAELNSQKAQAATRSTTRPRTQSELNQAIQRAYKEMPPEMASTIGETGNARILVEVPEHGSLSEEFSHLGGIGKMDERKARVESVLATLERNADTGGNNLDVVESWKAHKDSPASENLKKAWRTAARKAGLDPDSKTTQQIVEAIYHRRIANSHVPGWYTSGSERLSDDLLNEVLFKDDPAGRFWTQHEALRKQLDDVNTKIKMAEQGRIPTAEFVPPDYVTADELQEMTRMIGVRDGLVAERAAIDDQIREVIQGFDPEVIARQDEILDDLNKRRFIIEQSIWDLDDAPIREFENRYKADLLAQRDSLVEQLQNPDGFERAVYVREMLRKQVKNLPNKPYVMETQSIVGGGIDTSYWTPEMWESYYKQRAFRDEISNGYSEVFRRYDPSFSWSVEDYMMHMHAKPKSIIERMWEGPKTKKAIQEWKDNRLAALHRERPSDKLSVLKRQVEDEFNHMQGEPRIGVSTRDLHDEPVQFRQRKIKATVLEQKRGGMPINWETDSVFVLNTMHTKMLKWRFSTDMVEELRRNGLAVSGKTDTHTVPLQVAGLMAPLGDKNPFANLFVSPETKALFDRVVSGMSPVLFSNRGMQRVLELLGVWRRWWSASTLLPFPEYHVRNVVSDILRAQMEGLNIDIVDSNVRQDLRAAMELVRPGSETRFARYLPGTLQQAPESAGLSGILENLRAKFPNEAANLDQKTFLRYLHAHVMELDMRDVDRLLPEIKGAMNGKSSSLRFWNTEGPLFTWLSRNVANPSQNFSRVWLFLDQLRKHADSGLMGLDDAIKAASDSVRKSLFDYGDLTAVEQHIFKNVMPFYTYMAKSIPYHLSKVFTDPKVFAPYSRAYVGFWNAYDKEFMPDDARDFIVDQLGVPIYDKTDPETGERKYYMWSPQGYIGVGDLNEVADWARAVWQDDREGMARIVGSIVQNPAFQTPLETFMQTDLMTGREIDTHEVTTIFGVPMDWRVANLLRDFRLVNFIDSLNPGNLWTYIERNLGVSLEKRSHRNELPQAERFTKALIGARMFEVNPVDELTNRLRALKKEAQDRTWDSGIAKTKGNVLEAERNQAEALQTIKDLADVAERLSAWRSRARTEKALRGAGIAGASSR